MKIIICDNCGEKGQEQFIGNFCENCLPLYQARFSELEAERELHLYQLKKEFHIK